MHPVTTNAKGLRMLKASGVVSVYPVIVYKFRATTLLYDLKGTREGVTVLLSSRLTPLSVPENSQRTRIDLSTPTFEDLVY